MVFFVWILSTSYLIFGHTTICVDAGLLDALGSLLVGDNGGQANNTGLLSTADQYSALNNQLGNRYSFNTPQFNLNRPSEGAQAFAERLKELKDNMRVAEVNQLQQTGNNNQGQLLSLFNNNAGINTQNVDPNKLEARLNELKREMSALETNESNNQQRAAITGRFLPVRNFQNTQNTNNRNELNNQINELQQVLSRIKEKNRLLELQKLQQQQNGNNQNQKPNFGHPTINTTPINNIGQITTTESGKNIIKEKPQEKEVKKSWKSMTKRKFWFQAQPVLPEDVPRPSQTIYFMD